MRGGTSFNSDPRAAGRALPTSRAGPQQQQANTSLLRRRAGVASSRSVKQTPLVRLLAGVRRSGNAKSLHPSTTGGMLVKLSLCNPSECKEPTEKRGCILKIVPLFSFDFSCFNGRQELCTDRDRDCKEFKCAIHDDSALHELEIQPRIGLPISKLIQ
jgi:hypothetical protein